MLPKDPFMLLSYVNTKLRDEYHSLDEFCKSEGIEKDDLVAALGSAGFEYMESINQFR